MIFLASQIWIWIVAGFVFGAAIGWWLSGAMMLDLGGTKATAFKSQGSQPGSISVLSESLLQTQRELEACQQSLVDAEAKLKDLEVRFKPKDQTMSRGGGSDARATIQPSSRATAERDDLKLIYGIGPVIENKLAELDITTYRQIVSLTEEDILRVGEYLDYFPGRIERDGWLSSARELHRQKYGEEI